MTPRERIYKRAKERQSCTQPFPLNLDPSQVCAAIVDYLNEDLGPHGDVADATKEQSNPGMLARYQNCVHRILNLFPSDPLPAQCQAHALVQRLEALLNLGLLIPKPSKPAESPADADATQATAAKQEYLALAECDEMRDKLQKVERSLAMVSKERDEMCRRIINALRYARGLGVRESDAMRALLHGEDQEQS
jgi:hypothetical protein